MMDEYDKKILDVIQSDFPVVSRPYDEVGRRVGLTGNEVLSRVRVLRQKGVIRRMGASFQSRKLGFVSTLCAARVPEDRLDDFVAEVNSHSGVTHNYLREHDFNVWFTFIGPSREEVAQTLGEITERTGVEVLNLPAERLFKIKVDFAMDREEED